MSDPAAKDSDETQPLLGGTSSQNGTATVQQDASKQGSPRDGQEDGVSSRGRDDQGEPDAESTPPDHEPTTREIIKMIGPIYFGTFVAAADTTVLATLSGPITSSLNALPLLSWFATAYIIANAACQPLAGKLTDIFGRRAGLIFSYVFFLAGNLICGLATNGAAMIAGRVVAGMGGGGLNTISTIVASDVVPLRRRGVWQGFGNVCFSAGASLGAVLGGWISDSIGWRWAFIVQVPPTAACMALVWFAVRIPVKESDRPRLERVDFLGAVTLVASLVLLLLGVNSGGNTVPWLHPLPLTAVPLALACFAVYVRVELRAPEPVIPVRLMARRTVWSACLTNWFTTMAAYGTLYYAPIYFQTVFDMSAAQAGARLVPNSVGIALGSLSAGLFMRATGRYYRFLVGAQAVMVLGLALASGTWAVDSPGWLPPACLALVGFGYAGMLTTTVVALIAAVDHADQAVITSASYAFRSTGSVLGITACSAVFQNVLGALLRARLGDRPGADRVLRAVHDSLAAVRDLPPAWKAPVLQIYVEALRAVFLTILAMGAMGMLVSLFVREHKLHQNIARREEADDGGDHD